MGGEMTAFFFWSRSRRALQLAPPVMGGEIDHDPELGALKDLLQLAPPVMGGEMTAFA